MTQSERPLSVFLGATDRQREGQFRWHDGSPVTLDRRAWARDEPTNSSRQNCLLLLTTQVPLLSESWSDYRDCPAIFVDAANTDIFAFCIILHICALHSPSCVSWNAWGAIGGRQRPYRLAGCGDSVIYFDLVQTHVMR